MKIKKSSIASIPDFAVRVAAHAHAMTNWRAHMARVKADENSDIPPLQRHQAYDPPLDHPTVMAAVNESDEVAYDVVDDGPSDDHILRMKKNELLGRVHLAEVAAIEQIVPVGKRRYFNLIENDIRAEDQKRAMDFLTRKVGLLSKIGIGRDKTSDELSVEVAKGRPESHQKHLDDQADRNSRIDVINNAAAKAMHDIEDLTLDTIDAWQLPELKA